MRKLRKLTDTLRICTMMLLARTFGTYECSGWTLEVEYVRYRFMGRSWFIPTTAVEE